MQCGGSALYAHAALVHDGGEAHHLRLRQSCLLCHSGEAVGEFEDVPLGGGGALGELVDGGAGGEHRLLQAHAVAVAEDVGELAYVFHRVLAEVVAKGEV